MTDERWKTLMSFAQFMLGTVVLGVFGTIINHQIQTREVEIKEQELISKNLSTVLSSNTADKLLMAQFYATVTRSEEIRVRWREYHEILKAEIRDAKQTREKIASEINADMDAKELDQKQARIQQIDAKVTPGLTPQAVQADLPARVYVHIQNEAQRTRMSGIAKSLMAEGTVVVPGIQQRNNTPNECELRYFKLADATEAESLVLSLKQQGMNANAKYVPGYESVQKLRPRHFELWVPATWK